MTIHMIFITALLQLDASKTSLMTINGPSSRKTAGSFRGNAFISLSWNHHIYSGTWRTNSMRSHLRSWPPRA